jgi:hypothetical protein
MEDWCREVEFFHLPFPYILEGAENRSQDHMKQHEVARIARVAIDCFSNAKALPSPLVKNTGQFEQLV